jgi:hypothetical protein
VRKLTNSCLQEFPVSEAVFNFINAWSMMLWPLMLADPKGRNVKNKFSLYLGIQVRRLPDRCLTLPSSVFVLDMQESRAREGLHTQQNMSVNLFWAGSDALTPSLTMLIVMLAVLDQRIHNSLHGAARASRRAISGNRQSTELRPCNRGVSGRSGVDIICLGFWWQTRVWRPC